MYGISRKTTTVLLMAAVMALSVFCASSYAADGPGVLLSWKAPNDVSPGNVAGYNVYRSESVSGHYQRLNSDPVAGLSYEDRGQDGRLPSGLVPGVMYYYRVTTVFKDGGESRPTRPIGMKAGDQAASQYTLPEISFFTSDALGRVVYAGETAVFVLKGTPGLSAGFSIAGVSENIPMNEVRPGTYKGVYTVPEGAKVSGARASAWLTDEMGGRAAADTPQTINLLGRARPGLGGFYAGIVEADRVGLNWPAPASGLGGCAVFRDTNPILDIESAKPLTGGLAGGVCAYIDDSVTPGETYYYVLGSMDEYGGIEAYSENLRVLVPEAGKVSGVDSVAEDSAGRTLVPGDVLNVRVNAGAGGAASFSIGDAARDIAMKEAEPGTYLGTYTVREGDGVFRARVSVSLREADGKSRFASSATFVSVDAGRQGPGDAAQPVGPVPAVYGVSDDIQSVVGQSGRLTAGKTFTVTLTGEPGRKAFFNAGETIWKVPMGEDPDSPGTYVGRYTVRPGDNAGTSGDPLSEVFVTAYLESETGARSEPAVSPVPVVIDTSCDIRVDVSESRLPADATSQSRVTFTVTDADGEPVADRRLTLLLEPPPRYTGIVGGGGMSAFDPDMQEAADGGLGRLEADFDDLTDFSGQVSATYTSGFAAKTAMIVARDYSTGSVGMGYITTEIGSSVSIMLEDPSAPSGMKESAGHVYELVVELVTDDQFTDITLPDFMLGAIPDRLTADGRSRATVIATLTEDGIPVEDRNILFAVTGAGGSLSAPSALTDMLGRAQVFYIAGTRAGRALITATEAETGVSVTKTITLLADAPAKIFVSATPGSIPADGVSGSDILVGVADANNNPTEGVRLGYYMLSGTGYLSEYESVTDFDGTARVYYTAGREPGVVTVGVTAVSEPPTADELEKAMTRVAAPLVYDFTDLTELTVLKWYRSVGDRVGRGEPLALVDTPHGQMKVYSPATGTLDEIIIGPGVYVMEGREIGVVSR